MKRFEIQRSHLNFLRNVACIYLITTAWVQTANSQRLDGKDDYYVAAYIWPSCHHDERFGNMLWPDGTGEWEVIKRGIPDLKDTINPNNRCGDMSPTMTLK